MVNVYNILTHHVSKKCEKTIQPASLYAFFCSSSNMNSLGQDTYHMQYNAVLHSSMNGIFQMKIWYIFQICFPNVLWALVRTTLKR